MAHVCGLGYLLDSAKVRSTLGSIMKYNFREEFFTHLNYMRSFVLNDEQALLYGTYPRGDLPRRPCPRFPEVWTGVEYAAAAHMLYEGQTDNGLKCIAAIRSRYDGRKRNPFDEAECGHHYARAMASWAAVLALTGFRYSGVHHRIQFAATDGPSQFFWSNGYAWGACRQEPAEGGIQITLNVLHGSLTIQRLILKDRGIAQLDEPRTIEQGHTARFFVKSAV
jgi:hypothetical protein